MGWESGHEIQKDGESDRGTVKEMAAGDGQNLGWANRERKRSASPRLPGDRFVVRGGLELPVAARTNEKENLQRRFDALGAGCFD